MIKFAFTADAHLGQTQYGMSFRAQDYAKAFEEILGQTKALHCDYAVLGGDIFHSTRPPVDAVRVVKQWVDSLDDGLHRVLSIDGNHDNTGGKWLGLCGAITLGQWRSGPYQMLDKDRPDANYSERLKIFGIDGGSTQKIMEELEEFAGNPHLNDADILVMHLPLTEMTGFPTQVSCKDIAGVIKNTKVKLVLLGDIHDGREHVENGIRFVYSGSPEITASNENPKKSFLVVSAVLNSIGDWTFDVERIPLHPRAQVVLKIESEEDLKNLPSRLADPSLYHIEYDGAVLNAKERIVALAEKAGVRFRVLPMHKERQMPETADRSGFRASLADIIKEDFADDPEGASLVTAMLETPDNAVELAKKFLRNKGIKV